MSMRWRWPPENWCGKRCCCSGRRPTGGRTARRRARVAFGRRADVHQVERRAHRGAGALARVQRRERVLEDDLQAAARAAAAPRPRARRGRCRRAGCVPAGDRREPHHRQRGRGLARARFADDRQRGAARHVERDAVDRLDAPRASRTSRPSRAGSGPAGRRRAAACRRSSVRSCGAPRRSVFGMQPARPRRAHAPPASPRIATSAAPRAAQRGIACGQRSRKAQPLPSSQMRGHHAGDLGELDAVAVGRRPRRCCRVPAGRRSGRACRDGRALPSTCAVVPCSITRPAYITTTRSAISATTPMSCVMSRIAVPFSRCRSRSRSRICACTVTSSAVVGSSAIRMSGRQASAIAIITRWRMPPESWCGYSSTRRSGVGNADLLQHLDRAWRARRGVEPGVQAQRLDDLVADGEHRVQRGHRLLEDHRDAVAAHLAHARRRRRRRRSSPSNRTRPPLMRPGGDGISRISASAVMLLPQPDSPTTQSVSPARISKSTPLSTSALPRRVLNSTRRSSTCEQGGRRCPSAFPQLAG